ncbi:COG4223 family protein [Pseudooceanicola sp. MF1-13]|uniref:COG4223 family protein n=1 Tax=Pseudooceanicola sp. MF1-13 TaxID=3379095 RepID=UPI0038922F97
MARKKAPAKTEVDSETPKTDDTLPATDADATATVADASDTLPAETEDTTPPAAEGDDTPPVADSTDTLPGESDDTVSSDTSGDTGGDTTDSIDLPEPSQDDEPDTSTTVAYGDDPLDIDGQAEREDTPADITPNDYDAEKPVTAGTEPSPENAATPAPVVTEKRGGFFPMVLGGIIAAAIGFAAALGLGGQIPGLGGSSELTDQVAAQDQTIADLQEAVGSIDLSEIQTMAEDNSAALSELSDQLSSLTARVEQLEETAITQSVSEEARAAYEEELARLQEAMRQQREEVQNMVTEAESLRNTAAARSSETQARAAVTNILAALNNGDSYAEPLEQLTDTGTQIPQVLSDNVDGVPTLADLRDSFPDAARDALAVTRGAGNGSVTDFFKTQLGVRSLSPKDGNDPDAVLSRAEAAVAAGDIPTALTEIQALPQEAQAELADWRTAAETRLATVEAANGLMTELNTN